jgi:hypothetical protein
VFCKNNAVNTGCVEWNIHSSVFYSVRTTGWIELNSEIVCCVCVCVRACVHNVNMITGCICLYYSIGVHIFVKVSFLLFKHHFMEIYQR